MNKLHLAFAILLLSLGAACQETFAKNVTLATKKEKSDVSKHWYNYVQLFFGKRVGGKRDNMHLLFDLNGASTILGEKNSTKWGIDCDETVNSCVKISHVPIQIFENQMSYYRLPATIFATFDTNMAIAHSDDKKKMRVELIQHDDRANKWYIPPNGVLGLSPASAFANYVKQVSDAPYRLGFQFF